jgi:methylase of polypeptide subunit release factors
LNKMNGQSCKKVNSDKYFKTEGVHIWFQNDNSTLLVVGAEGLTIHRYLNKLSEQWLVQAGVVFSTSNRHQSPTTNQLTLFCSHNKSASDTSKSNKTCFLNNDLFLKVDSYQGSCSFSPQISINPQSINNIFLS